MSTIDQTDRSQLEKKDKTQLLELVGEMKLKATQRTKKADLVELILSAAPSSQRSTQTQVASQTQGASQPRGTAQRPERKVRTPDASSPAVQEGLPLGGSQGEAASASPKAASPLPRQSGQRLITSTSSRGVSKPGADGAKVVEEARSKDPEAQEAGRGGPVQSHNGHSPGSSTAGLFPPITVVPKTRPSSDSEPQGAPEHATARRSDGPSEANDGQSRRNNRRRRGRERPQERSERDGSETFSSTAATSVELSDVTGILDLRDEGFGFIRLGGFLPSPKDVYVPVSMVRKFGLRKGDVLAGGARPANNNEKYPALVRLDLVSGHDPEASRSRVRFEDLTPLFPDEKLILELPGDQANQTGRIIDLISPIGKGQRGLIVSPPKAGKTTIMKQIAHCIETNNPGVHLMVLLVDERPEEVTDIRRSVKGEVIASTFDRPADEHTAVSELAIERAKRMVEAGRDVVIILDGITRLARAYNLAQPATGRIMSGGVDSGALYPPKKFFGAARNVEEGGSLTILATALVETGSKMDEVIFEEFKGTGNMELRLDRKLAERRLYPAIDVAASSTRHEELLFTKSQLSQVWKLRRVLSALAQEGSSAPGLELLIDKIRNTRSNEEFLADIAKSPMI